ncbi:hypothetical protein [Verrucosispora sp. NA02020]|nr:hypothetical protein [Verrucosispora sp. NA02020]
MAAEPGEPWCVDCRENLPPASEYAAGVHISQVDVPDPDEWKPIR